MKSSQFVATVVHSKRAKEGTIKVEVKNIKTNSKYRKQYKTTKLYQVHYDKKEEIVVGSEVVIVPCAPVSKTKRFCIVEVRGVR